MAQANALPPVGQNITSARNDRGKVVERRRQSERRIEAMRALRYTIHTRWVELSENIDPYRGSFYQSAASAQSKMAARDKKIKDDTAGEALRTLQNGMMSGATSPSRPWFRVTLDDHTGLAENPEVKLWLSEVGKRMLRVFAGSNAYHVIHNAYGDLGLFGTAGFLVLEDFEDVVRFYPLVIGEFFIALDERLAVNTVGREFVMTVFALVQQFGREACSDKVKALYDRGEYDTNIDVVHLIEPNVDRDMRKADAKGMAFRERYWEKGEGTDILAERGFHEFPAMIARWDVNGSDAWGTSPGMRALPNQKQLHSQQVWKGKGISKQVDPPLNAPASMKNEPVTGIPGGINYTKEGDTKNGVTASYQPNLRLGDLKEDMNETRAAVKRAFYADLFFAISQMEGVQPRGNKEIEERKDEKFVQLGPVLERLHGEWLKPIVMRVYCLMERAGLIPPKPDAMANADPDIEFVSVLAIAQKAIATVGIERLLQLIGQIIEAFPQASQKIDILDLIDDYAEFLGVDPRLIVPTDDVKAAMDAQAKQAAQQQALAAAPPLAGAASDLANAAAGGGLDALRQMMGPQV